MFSGTVFVRQRKPDPTLTLPRSCWAVYDRLDGEAPIGAIADALDLSEAETFAAVRQLQQRDLIAEPMLSYPAYRRREQSGEARAADEDAVAPMSGDGIRSSAVNGVTASTADDDASREEAIHLPTLWDWLAETTDTVTSYKNTQAFVLMEASDALEAVGVANMEDLEEMEQCSDPAVIQALEAAIENNLSEPIPDDCYR